VKVLVTGGAGLVGMALRRVLPEHGHAVVATDITSFGRPDPDLVLLPLEDNSGHERLVVEHAVDTIIHSGGISGPMMLRDEPGRIVDINVGSTVALLDVARRHRLQRFLLMSSHVVYGDVGPALIDEDRPLHPTTTYAASKVAGEALVESFSRQWGLSAASLRLTRVYGPYRRANCFLRQTLIDAAAGETTTIPSDPAFPYHFVSVEDVAGAAAACLAAPELRHTTYNVTSGEVLTMPQVRDIAERAVPGARITLVPGRDDAPELQTEFTMGRLADDAGWTPAWPLARGLADYAARYAADGTIV
jgi:nucleoside-diphosphate-sugar epimerase